MNKEVGGRTKITPGLHKGEHLSRINLFFYLGVDSRNSETGNQEEK